MGEQAPGAAPNFRAALIQMCSGRDVEANIATVDRLVRQAVQDGAHYVQTPEVTSLIEMKRDALFEKAEPQDGNRALIAFCELARETGVWLHIGSMVVRLSDEKVANRAFLIAPDGAIVATYDKIHMFDVELPNGERYRESRNYQPGNRAVVADLPWGRLALTICYDLRFAPLYHALAEAGAAIIAIPSAFTAPTGRAHWHALLRARAIETQAFVLAAAQAGEHESGRKTYGHSLIVSPWGEVLAEGDGETVGVVMADIDLALKNEAAARVPSREHIVPFELAHAEPSGLAGAAE